MKRLRSTHSFGADEREKNRTVPLGSPGAGGGFQGGAAGRALEDRRAIWLVIVLRFAIAVLEILNAAVEGQKPLQKPRADGELDNRPTGAIDCDDIAVLEHMVQQGAGLGARNEGKRGNGHVCPYGFISKHENNLGA